MEERVEQRPSKRDADIESREASLFNCNLPPIPAYSDFAEQRREGITIDAGGSGNLDAPDVRILLKLWMRLWPPAAGVLRLLYVEQVPVDQIPNRLALARGSSVAGILHGLNRFLTTYSIPGLTAEAEEVLDFSPWIQSLAEHDPEIFAE